MKILLHSDRQEDIAKSGVGQAIRHQMKALQLVGVDYTLDPEEDYDLVHINTIFPESYAMGKRAHKSRKKVIFHAHSTEEDFRNSFMFSNQVAPLFKTWIKACYASSDLILTPTPYAKHLLESYDMGKPIEVISNGVDLNLFCQDPQGRARFRSTYGFADDTPVVMSVGLYIERKGILDFVDLARRMPEVQFIWFGYLNLNTVPPKIRKAVETDLPNLHFPGYIPSEKLKDAYAGADLFLFMTYEETEGIVLLEALASRIPVLIRDIPIYQDWLRDGVHLYKASTQEQFRQRVTGILQHTLADTTDGGYEIAQQRDLVKIGAQLKDIYERVLAMPDEPGINLFGEVANLTLYRSQNEFERLVSGRRRQLISGSNTNDQPFGYVKEGDTIIIRPLKLGHRRIEATVSRVRVLRAQNEDDMLAEILRLQPELSLNASEIKKYARKHFVCVLDLANQQLFEDEL